jgi:hypothetical protein
LAIRIQNTRDFKTHGVKVLIHGPAGSEKTRMCATAPKPIVISAESGLLSLAEANLPYIEVKTLIDVQDAFQWCTESEESKSIETICLDSISEIAEVMLTTYKKEEKDPRAAYGRMNDDIAITIRMFRDIKGKNVYFSAKQIRIEDENHPTRFMASMPGKVTLNATDYYFDLVAASRMGQLEDGTTYRYLQTVSDLSYVCKDRSGKLFPREKPDLGYIFNKIAGVSNNSTKEGNSG